MIFNQHSNLTGLHAFLSASQYHWINYDEAKIDHKFKVWEAAKRGTALHEFAHTAINLGIKQARTKNAFNRYVNDGIGYRMTTEQVLFYSINCFGTADTICFRNNLLRIHDYKSGTNPSSMHQVEVYAALFCLEYGFRPSAIEMELRIYQNDDVVVHIPDPDFITHIMDRIITFDKRIELLKPEG